MTMFAILQVPGGIFQPPEVSQDEIKSFHDAHFSNAALDLFDFQFYHPENAQDDDQQYEEYEGYYGEEEDDNLGYYPDGVKRTLTDEQIAIFRHSEIEALRRDQEKAAKLNYESSALLQGTKGENASKLNEEPTTNSPPTIQGGSLKFQKEEEVQDGSEDGEIEEEAPKEITKAEARRIKKQRAKRKKLEQRKFIPEKKPDLRKRTWDVVEAGMDSLDYDELDGGQDAAATPATKRRQISYDD
ncbi:hypothetical protein F4804DRAFT_301929 [Jackrogersella minutella]|nr:hypothetical protein F4804DRAFT_301929 [Jackrogersella minutella]